MIKKIATLILYVSAMSASAEPHNFQTLEGAALYLMRSGFETHRAEFANAHDCRHIAKIMNKAEPLVRWYCSTSTLPFKYNCRISNVQVINTDTSDVAAVNTNFSMSLNRNKASTSLTSAASSFSYKESEKYFELTNDYPYVNGNYFSRAIYKIRINRQNGSFIVSDINLDENGRGVCEKL